MSRTVFGRFEVESCKDYRDSDKNLCVEVCEDDEAEFYGVYCRNKKGFALHITDYDTRSEAESFAKNQNKNKR